MNSRSSNRIRENLLNNAGSHSAHGEPYHEFNIKEHERYDPVNSKVKIVYDGSVENAGN